MYHNKQRYKPDGGRWDDFKSQLTEDQKWQIKDIRECLKYGLTGPQWRSTAKGVSQFMAYQMYEEDKHTSFYELAERVMLKLDFEVDPDSTLAEYCPRTVRRTHEQVKVEGSESWPIVSFEEGKAKITLNDPFVMGYEEYPPASFFGYAEKQLEREEEEEVIEETVDVPFQSECHKSLLLIGEVLVGGKRGEKGRPKGKKRWDRKRDTGVHGTVRIRTMGALLPESVIVDLPFVLEGLITAAGASGAGLALHLNDSYDVDLALASAATIAFQFYADGYENFRDLRSKLNFDHWNQESFPGLFYLLPSTENLSAATAISDRVAANPLGVSHSLQAKGMYGCQRRLIRSHSTCTVVGSKAPLTADNFGGTTSGSLRVADHLYWNFYFKATGGNVLTATGGLGYRLTMTQTVMFYARKAITN